MSNKIFNPYAFFHYLKTCKSKGSYILSEINPKSLYNIKLNEYYNCLSFKTYICEIIYNAINLFPDISEYRIMCKNECGETYLSFALFEDEIMDDEHPCMAKFKSVELEEIYTLSLKEIKSLYCNNRYSDIDTDIVNTLVMLMYSDGSTPTVYTSYTINKDVVKQATKK